MRFRQVTLEDLLGELSELPSDWMDDTARGVVAQIHVAGQVLRKVGSEITDEDLAGLLGDNPEFLDVCRLFLGKSQESVAHELSDHLGGPRMGWPRLRSLARKEPGKIATALVAAGLPEVIRAHLERRWEAEDILIERYKMSRGRAIAGQKRGRSLEDEVEAVLEAAGVPFERNLTFTGHKEETAKCDFAIPSKSSPKIVIEAKGFEATGSKLTDFLGDILKIGRAKGYHMYFFLVTDGRGWFNRQSDLRHIVAYHREGLIDMIYTQQRLGEMAETVRHIFENE
jgi:hypothetical protein